MAAAKSMCVSTALKLVGFLPFIKQVYFKNLLLHFYCSPPQLTADHCSCSWCPTTLLCCRFVASKQIQLHNNIGPQLLCRPFLPCLLIISIICVSLLMVKIMSFFTFISSSLTSQCFKKKCFRK